MDQTDWTVIETQFDPSQLHHKETLFTVGNGYLGTRGTFEEGYPGACPVTLINGVYDDVPVMHTELVNCPDWLPLAIVVAGDHFGLDEGQVLSYQRKLYLRWGLLSRDVLWHSPGGHTVYLRFERMVSMCWCYAASSRLWIMHVRSRWKLASTATRTTTVLSTGNG